MRRSMVLLAVAGYVAGLAPVGCGRSNADGRISATGTIETTEVNIATKSAGIIRSLIPQEGDRLDSGQVVAEIDHSDLDRQLEQAQAGLALARANLELAINGPQREDIEQAEAVVRQAQVQLDAARTDLQRMEQLARDGTATQKQLDDARTRTRTAEAALAMTEATLAKLRSGTRHEQIAGARAQVAQAEATVGLVRQRIQDTVVRSPLGGVVTHRLAEPGEMASPGSALLSVAALDRVWLTVYLSTVEVGTIRLGEPVEVYIDAEPNRARRGRVTYISSSAEFTPKNIQTKDDRVKLVFAVKIALDNRDGTFKPGLPADAVFGPTVSGEAAQP